MVCTALCQQVNLCGFQCTSVYISTCCIVIQSYQMQLFKNDVFHLSTLTYCCVEFFDEFRANVITTLPSCLVVNEEQGCRENHLRKLVTEAVATLAGEGTSLGSVLHQSPRGVFEKLKRFNLLFKNVFSGWLN